MVEYIKKFNDQKYWLAFIICEGVGEASGCFFDGKNEIKLNGMCRIEPQRQVSILGHNFLKLDFLKPPKGFGIDAELYSHYLKKKINTRLHFAPRPSLKFNIEKLKVEDLLDK